MGTTTKSKLLIIIQIRSFFRVSFINICVGQRHAYQEKKKKKRKRKKKQTCISEYIDVLYMCIGVCLSNFYFLTYIYIIGFCLIWLYYVYGSQLKPTSYVYGFSLHRGYIDLWSWTQPYIL